LDSELVHSTRQYWYNQFTTQNFGLRDNEFDGLDVYGIKIDTFGGRDSFYQIFSQKRILIENLIADLKDWRALKEPMRVKVKNSEQLLEIHHMQWTIVAVFHNNFRNV
jgi:hypothetical protein